MVPKMILVTLSNPSVPSFQLILYPGPFGNNDFLLFPEHHGRKVGKIAEPYRILVRLT